ncbi:hypothetical protein I5S53_17925 [Pseudomonas juntendi]|uniref:hypothetical protein n=1 Tax=Pseudomonas TaxID=286 RepID=UPI0008119DBD|nr:MULTISPECIES: hypothetical protein [Pseudomonas]EKT4452719.1 hypothetical protein [Pseudomonas putida]MBH3385830.1 hypothetical protein [Pseudomonas juntendi]
MKKTALKCLAWGMSIALVATAIVLGRGVPFSEQWPLFEALRTTASIIFAVVGAWLAIIYPERLRMSFQKAEGAPVSSNGGMNTLFTPIVHSTAILCIILFIGMVAPLLKRLDLLLPHTVPLRGVSYGVLASLTLWQLWTVVLSFVPADIVKSHTDSEKQHLETTEGYKNQSNYVPRPKDDS